MLPGKKKDPVPTWPISGLEIKHGIRGEDYFRKEEGLSCMYHELATVSQNVRKSEACKGRHLELFRVVRFFNTYRQYTTRSLYIVVR